MSTLLETGGLSVRFGGVHALSDVDLKVEEGQLVGLIGPNGAGKTTFIDAISGFVPSTGSVILEGTDITGMAPADRAHRGLTRTWQAAAGSSRQTTWGCAASARATPTSLR